MEYLKKSFSVGLGGKAFGDGWDCVFGKSPEAEAAKAAAESITNVEVTRYSRDLIAEQAAMLKAAAAADTERAIPVALPAICCEPDCHLCDAFVRSQT